MAMRPPPRPAAAAVQPTLRTSIDPSRTAQDLLELNQISIKEIENLPVDQRFQKLGEITAVRNLDASNIMTFHVMDSFDKGVEAKLSLSKDQLERLLTGKMQPKLRTAKLQQARLWTYKINFYIWELQELTNLTFDTQVMQHVIEQVADIEGYPKLIALTKEENFPLFGLLRYKHAYRLGLWDAIPYGTSFADGVVGLKARDYEAYVKRAGEVHSATAQYIRMVHYDEVAVKSVNDLLNQLGEYLPELTIVDGIYAVTPVIARIDLLEDPEIPCIPEWGRLKRDVIRLTWMVGFLQHHGTEDSLALKEARAHLAMWEALKERYDMTIAKLLADAKHLLANPVIPKEILTPLEGVNETSEAGRILGEVFSEDEGKVMVETVTGDGVTHGERIDGVETGNGEAVIVDVKMDRIESGSGDAILMSGLEAPTHPVVQAIPPQEFNNYLPPTTVIPDNVQAEETTGEEISSERSGSKEVTARDLAVNVQALLEEPIDTSPIATANAIDPANFESACTAAEQETEMINEANASGPSETPIVESTANAPDLNEAPMQDPADEDIPAPYATQEEVSLSPPDPLTDHRARKAKGIYVHRINVPSGPRNMPKPAPAPAYESDEVNSGDENPAFGKHQTPSKAQAGGKKSTPHGPLPAQGSASAGEPQGKYNTAKNAEVKRMQMEADALEAEHALQAQFANIEAPPVAPSPQARFQKRGGGRKKAVVKQEVALAVPQYTTAIPSPRKLRLTVKPRATLPTLAPRPRSSEHSNDLSVFATTGKGKLKTAGTPKRKAPDPILDDDEDDADYADALEVQPPSAKKRKTPAKKGAVGPTPAKIPKKRR